MVTVMAGVVLCNPYVPALAAVGAAGQAQAGLCCRWPSALATRCSGKMAGAELRWSVQADAGGHAARCGVRRRSCHVARCEACRKADARTPLRCRRAMESCPLL